jgi:hypothetical protein
MHHGFVDLGLMREGSKSTHQPLKGLSCRVRKNPPAFMSEAYLSKISIFNERRRSSLEDHHLLNHDDDADDGVRGLAAGRGSGGGAYLGRQSARKIKPAP